MPKKNIGLPMPKKIQFLSYSFEEKEIHDLQQGCSILKNKKGSKQKDVDNFVIH